MAGRSPYYWSVPRLQAIFNILCEEAEAQPGSSIRTIKCTEGLARKIYGIYRKSNTEVTHNQVSQALTLLSKMRILDEGKPGPKAKESTRKLNPDVIIAEDGIVAGKAQLR